MTDKFKVKRRRFPKEFRRVANYIKEQSGMTVVLGEETNYKGPFSREIIIHHNYDLRNNGLFILLFECGKIEMSYNHTNPYDKNSQPREYNWYQYRNDWIAWDNARELAHYLKLDLQLDDFNKFKASQLVKYFSEKVW